MLQMHPEGDLFVEHLTTRGTWVNYWGEKGGSHFLRILPFSFPTPGCDLNCLETGLPSLRVLVHEFPFQMLVNPPVAIFFVPVLRTVPLEITRDVGSTLRLSQMVHKA